MANISSSLIQLTDQELLAEVKRLAQHERHATARLIASLAEMDVRKLYLGEGCSSLFTYCTQVLHLSEHAAYGRIEAARAVKRAVWARDGGRCAFVGTNGRCTEQGFLEFHHVVPYATGGKATFENLELRCRAHNAHEADRFFGPRQPSGVREVRAVFGSRNSVRTESQPEMDQQPVFCRREFDDAANGSKSAESWFSESAKSDTGFWYTK